MKPTRYFISYLLIGSIIFLSSCSKSNKKFEYDLPVQTVSFAIDTTTSLGDKTLGSTTFSIDLQGTLVPNNVKINDIESIKLTSADFSMLKPDSMTFNKFANLYSYVSISGLLEKKISSINYVPSGQYVLKTKGEDADVFSVISSSVVTLRVSGFVTDTIATPDSVQATLRFRVYTKIPI